MRNLSLDVFWIGFMPVYQHSIGVVTVILSVLVIYLMLTRTPRHGQSLARYLILMQLAILIVDLGWGFLVCPVFLFPLTAILCNGTLCGSEMGMHTGVVLMELGRLPVPTDILCNGALCGSEMGMHAGVVVLFQCTVQVAIALCLTLHYKYTAIAKLTNHRYVTMAEKVVTRVIFTVALEMPVAVMVIAGVCQQEMRTFLRSENQLPLVALLDSDVNLRGVAYSITLFMWIPITLAIVVLVAIIISVGGCIFWVVQTLRMLSVETSVISERTRKMQQQLTYTLVMQLGMPLGIQVLPMFIYVVSMSLFAFNPGSMNFLLCVQLCHASFHTIFLIVTTPSYRRAIICNAVQRKDTASSAVHTSHSLFAQG